VRTRPTKPIAISTARVLQVALPDRERKKLDLPIEPRRVVARPADAPGQAAGLAATLTAKRKEEKAKDRPGAPVIVRAQKPPRAAEPPKQESGTTLADLARKRREKKDGP
jgi:hypothetical protein